MRRGRPIKTYTASYDPMLRIPGLSRTPDGRWRVLLNGKEQRFTEPDERRAIERARKLLGMDMQAMTAVEVPVGELIPGLPDDIEDITSEQADRLDEVYTEHSSDESVGETLPMVPVRFDVPDCVLWPWLRQYIATDPVGFAKKVGIPELAGWRHLGIPKPSLRVTEVIESYRQQSPSTQKSKSEAIAPFNRLIESTGARTLDDLTTDALMAFRSEIESDPKLASPGTRKSYYGRIRSIISFGLKVGMDSQQIRSALDRAKVLWTPDPLPQLAPNPISPEHLTILLRVGGAAWKPWLLAGLNLCMHVEDVCGLMWGEFDLDKRTYASIRKKTRRMRIPQAATLWPETLEAFQQVQRRGRSPHIFTSIRGTRYNKNTRINDFAELRDKAGLPTTITFDCLRDGAYTAACHGTTDERLARILAGHRAPGMQDNYVLRNPEIVRPACEAVYATYRDAIGAATAA